MKVNSAQEMSTSSCSKKGMKRKLDIDDCGKSLWLVKIPANVAEKWRTAQPGESLGSLSIDSIPSNVPGKKNRSKVSIQLRNDTPSNSGASDQSIENPVVTEFTLDEIQNLKGTSSNMMVFDSNEGREKFSVKGHVTTFWSLTPKDNEQYRQALKARQLNASTRNHSVKSIASKTVFEQANKVQEVGFVPPAYVADRRKELSGVSGAPIRRSRGEKPTEKEVNELKHKLLEVFGKREFLTFKEINGYCQAYESDLRDLVKKYCVYHSKGSLKTYYELKAEYKGKMSSVI